MAGKGTPAVAASRARIAFTVRGLEPAPAGLLALTVGRTAAVASRR